MKTYKGMRQVMELSKKLGRPLLDIACITMPQGNRYSYLLEYNAKGEFTKRFQKIWDQARRAANPTPAT